MIVPLFPLLFLWEAFFSGGGRLSRQMLQSLKTFSSSLLSGIRGLRAKVTQLSLVGKIFLSDTIPVQKESGKSFLPHCLYFLFSPPGFHILSVYCFNSTYTNVIGHCIVLYEHDVKNHLFSKKLNLTYRNALCSWFSLQHMLRSLV